MRARVALIFAGLAVLVVLALALAPVDLRRALGYAAEHPVEVALALLAYTGAFALRAASWRPLLGARAPLGRLFALLMGALFLNHAAPAKAGDLARMYALSRREYVSPEKAVVSVVLGRVVDLAGLLAVLAACSALIRGVGPGEFALPALAVGGAALALVLLARIRLPEERFGAVGRRVGAALGALRETPKPALLAAFAFAAPAWVLEAGILLVVGRGLGLGLSPAEVVAATCFAVLVAAVPLAPGSIGTYEAGMVAALLAFGVSAEPAFAAAVVTHALKFLYAFATAPFALTEGLAAVKKGDTRPDEARIEV